jgi:poly-gamma-glutamate synthesis protein (capsule biosynthesis protein)
MTFRRKTSLGAIFAALLLLCACAQGTPPALYTAPVETAPPTTTAPPPAVVTFMAVGDNLIHKPIYEQARARSQGGGYDFRPAYAEMRGLLGQADLAFINQETVVAGALGAPSGYPMFNSPTQLGDAVYDLGFRIVGLSNNHMLDRGAAGVYASLDYWAGKEDLTVFGAYRDAGDFQIPRLHAVNGITFAFTGATFSYNGLQLPADSELVLPRLEQEELLREAVEAARPLADVVVVGLHWGDEDSQIVNSAQKELARKLADWGADIILGTHPHVLQAMEYLEKPDGGRAFVAYSLGNFFSAQAMAPNLVGGVLELTVKKDGGKITIEAPRFYPTVTQYESGFANVRVLPWESYTPALAAAHGVRRNDSRFGYDYILNLLQNTIPEEYLVL